MKTLRLIVLWLGLVGVLLALVVLTAVSPPLQTWAAERALNRTPGVRASIGSLSAGFGRIDIEKARIESGGAVLSVPLLQAQVPLTRAVLQHTVSVEGVLAKGWTLDLSHAGVLTNGRVSPGESALFVLGAINSLHLPVDASLSGVDLEGDVLLPGPSEEVPSKIHLVVSGGGLAAGHDGEFSFEASAEGTGSPVSSAFARGTLRITMGGPRTFDALSVSAEVTLVGDAAQKSLAASVVASASRGPGGQTYSLSLNRGSRPIATLKAAPAQAGGGLKGTWTADVSEADMAPFSPFASLPPIAAVGEGTFTLEPGLSRGRASGRLHSTVGSLGFLAPSLTPIGMGTLDTEFAVSREGNSLHIDHLKLSFSGSRAAVSVTCLQAFDFSGQTHRLTVARPNEDFLSGSLAGVPLECIPSPSSRLRFSGGELACQFVVRPHDDGFALRLLGPLEATGARVATPDSPVGSPLDLSVPLEGEMTPKGWQVTAGPASVRSQGRSLAQFSAKASRLAGADQPISIAGNWTAATSAAGGPSSGELTAKVNDTASVDCSLTWGGSDPSGPARAAVHADVDFDGNISFTAPVHLGSGPKGRVLSLEGSVSPGRKGPEIDLHLSSEEISVPEILLVTGPIASAAGGSLSPGNNAAGTGIPFWGAWSGAVSLSFKRLHLADQASYDDVGAELKLARDQVRLENGRTWVLGHNLGKFEGTLSFDPAAAVPYALKGSGSVDTVDAPAFFGASSAGQPAPVEGHFSVNGTIAGSGAGIEQLVRGVREEIHVTGASGVFRILKADVTSSVPTPATPVTDALGTVGSAVGSVFGIHHGIDRVDRNPVSPAADAVITFTYDIAEIGFDRFAATLTGCTDGALHLNGIEMDCPEERLRGSGEIAPAAAVPFSKRPLSLDLELSVKGHPAELLSKAGLLSQKKDAAGFAPLKEHVKLGGTLEQIDTGGWHDLLAKAVSQPAPPPKKGG